MNRFYPLLLLLAMIACSPRLADMAVGDQVGEWKVANGQLMLEGSNNDQLAEHYWQVVNELLPSDSLAKYLASLRLYTDGPEDDLGGMVQMDSINLYWQLDLDTADFNLNNTDSAYVLEYHHTLVHEYGHLLSLNANQIEPSNDEYQDPEKGYLTEEGYALPHSYLAKFVAQFWPDTHLYEWDEAVETKSEKKRDKRLFQFYLSHPDRYVSAYAAESPEEDFAEAWTFFILCDAPKGTSAMEQKLRFFRSFPELVKLREDIRSKLPFIPMDYLERFERY